MLPFVLAVGGIWASLGMTKVIGGAVTTSEVLGDKKKLAENKRAFKIGENPHLLEHKKQKQMEMMKKGIPMPSESYILFDILEDDLPKQLHWLSGKWILTEQEQLRLFDMIRRECLTRRIGSFANDVIRLCEKHGVDYDELGSCAWAGGPSDFGDLRWLSENRLKDPIIRMQFAASVR